MTDNAKMMLYVAGGVALGFLAWNLYKRRFMSGKKIPTVGTSGAVVPPGSDTSAVVAAVGATVVPGSSAPAAFGS